MGLVSLGVRNPTPPFAQLIRQAREAKGLSRPALARKIGVSHQAVEFWETGRVRRPSFENLVRLARELEIPLEQITADVEAMGYQTRSELISQHRAALRQVARLRRRALEAGVSEEELGG